MGEGNLLDKTFVDMCKRLGQEYLKSDVFWTVHKISFPQAIFDREYLYGILVTATKGKKSKIILSHQVSKDGILAWDEFLNDFDNEGFDDLRLQHLEVELQRVYNSDSDEGLAEYIDNFGATIAELEAISPNKYTDRRKKRQLLSNMREAQGMSHLLQRCMDDKNFTYANTALYLRKNAKAIDYYNIRSKPKKLLHIDSEAFSPKSKGWILIKLLSYFSPWQRKVT